MARKAAVKTVPVSKLGYDTTKKIDSLHSVPPQNHRGASLQTDDKRLRLASALNAYSDTLTVPPVNSNEELINRAEQYFKFCADRLLYPTYEGLAAFLGYDNTIFFKWPRIDGEKFHDGLESTTDILLRCRAVIDAVDGDLVSDGSVDKIQWIFRRKAQSGWVEKVPDNNQPAFRAASDILSPEEIAKLLPDLCVDVQDED